jgi:CheY-like chemotaxis protein
MDACLVKPVRQSQLFQALTGTWAKRSTGSLAALAEKAADGRENLPGPPQARVLVADDNVVNQRVVVRMLENLGLRADVAANGREVLEMLRLMDYDLVLIDCRMPVMGGREAVAEIRRLEGAGRHTPVISMSGGESGDCSRSCLECGMDDRLNKPVRLESLLGALQTVGFVGKTVGVLRL